MTVHELFEELQACNPRYAQQYPTLRAAAEACNCVALFEDYLRSVDGQRYRESVATVPDVRGAIAAAQQAADSLPYTLDTIGLTATVEDA